MKLGELLATAGDTMTVRRVFAEPYEKNNVTVIPGAMVSGGGGGGGGHDEKGQQGEGGGFGMNARPAGAFVIKDGNVAWRPAVDVNRMLMVAGAVAVASVLTWGRIRGQQRGRMRAGGGRMSRERGMGGRGMMRGRMMGGAQYGRRLGRGEMGTPMLAERIARRRMARERMGRERMAREFMAAKNMTGKGMIGKRMGRKRS